MHQVLLLACAIALAPPSAAQQSDLLEGPSYTAGWGGEVGLGELTGDGIRDLVRLDYFTGNALLAPGLVGGGFGPSVQIGSGAYSVGLSIADLDGDGDDDIAFARQSGATDLVTALISQGGGAFVPVDSTIGAPSPLRPRSLELADLDGDGHLDAVALHRPGGPFGTAPQGAVVTLLGDGSGGFVTGSIVSVGDDSFQLSVGDLDGDGVPDVVTSNRGTSDVSLLIGDGVGGLLPPQTIAVPSALGILIGDADGDGNADVVVGHETDGFTVLYGDGAGALTPSTVVGSDGMYAIVLADLDGDGAIDVSGGFEQLAVYPGDGAGGFPTREDSTLGPPWAMVSEDLDADGFLDLVVARGINGVTVLHGKGTGKFAQFFRADASGPWVRTGDLDADGRADLVVPMYNAGVYEVRALLGDGAGEFALADVEPHAMPVTDACIADLDGDGDLDVAAAEFFFGTFLSNGLSVLLGDGAGGFTANEQILPAVSAQSPNAIGAGDFDGDGRAEVALAIGYDRVDILDVDGAGATTTVGTLPVPYPVDVEVADLDLDGALDLAIARYASSPGSTPRVVDVSFGDGAGGFGPTTSHTAGTSPRHARAGDVNDDGYVDLAVLSYIGQGINPAMVLLPGAGGGAFAPAIVEPMDAIGIEKNLDLADLDGDGLLDAVTIARAIYVGRGTAAGGFADFEEYAYSGVAGSVALDDFDGDGAIDVAALQLYLEIHPNLLATPVGLTSFGTGTFGCEGAHLALADGSPILGSSLTLTCNQAPAHGNGLWVGSLGKLDPGVSVLGMVLHASPLGPAFFSVPATANASGIATADIVLPSNPTAAGVEVHQQWAWAWTGSACMPSALGLSTSRGLTLTLQP